MNAVADFIHWHPWMTFFIILAFLDMLGRILRR